MNRFDLIQLVAAAIEDAEANDARYEDLAIAAIAVLRPIIRAEALDEAARALDAWDDLYGDNAAAEVRALKEKQ